jgi:short chain dehydrogenase
VSLRPACGAQIPPVRLSNHHTEPLFQRKGTPHEGQGEQRGPHPDPGRRGGLEHDRHGGAVHRGVARDGALRGNRARAAWRGGPRRWAQSARGAAAVEAIRGTGGSVQFLRADLGDAAQVRDLAAFVLARSGPVHVLIHSAGGLVPAGARTREGADRGSAQNFLGAFLLTRLLEERPLASAPAR